MDAVGPDEHRDEASALHRREFLRRAGLIAGAAVVGPGLTRTVASQLTAGGARAGRAPRITPESVFDAPAAEAPFDTVVVVMMENRSFDHFLGWLGTDAAYLDAGRAALWLRLPHRRPSGPHLPDPIGRRGRDPLARRPGRAAVPLRRVRRGHPGPRVGRRPRAARARVPRSRDGQQQRHVRGRLLPRIRHGLPRRHDAALHDGRPLVLVAARTDLPEPSVPAHRAIGGQPRRPGAVEARHLRRRDDLGPAPGRARARRVLLHRPAHPAVVRASVLRRVAPARGVLRRRGEGQARQRRDDRSGLPYRATNRRSPGRRHPYGPALDPRCSRRSRSHRSGSVACSC